MQYNRNNTIFLFDVEGTLTPNLGTMSEEVRIMLADVRQRISIGFVSSSLLEKQYSQLGTDCLKFFDFSFPEHGLLFYYGENLMFQKSIIQEVGNEIVEDCLNYCLRYISRLDCPIKRGSFLSMGSLMINISPAGKNSNEEEKRIFKEFDDEHKIRKNMIEALEKEFEGENLQFRYGDQESINCYPFGWDKSYCIKHIHEKGIKKIFFFGNDIGGDDNEIYHNKSVVGTSVTDPEDTIKKAYILLKSMDLVQN